MRQHQVTVINLVPSLAIAFIDYLGRLKQRFSPSLRIVVSTGEPLSRTLASELLTYLPSNTHLLNSYGVTETTVDCTYRRVFDHDCAPSSLSSFVPIGFPLPNYICHVIQEEDGIGELFIGGPTVFQGYLNRGPNPLDSRLVMIDGSMCYRTGDLVKIVNDELAYVGRRDFQVKIRGQRIETGEVETVILRECRDQLNACVILANDDRLIAYVQSRSSDTNIEQIVNEACQQHLPTSMIPEVIVVLDQFPLNANGKVDRTRLPLPSRPKNLVSTDDEPQNELELYLHALWCRLLRIDRVPCNVNLFALGANSLHFMLAANDYHYRQQTKDVQFDLPAFIRHATIAHHAQILATKQNEIITPSVWQSQHLTEAPASFEQEAIWLDEQMRFQSDNDGVAVYHIVLAFRILSTDGTVPTTLIMLTNLLRSLPQVEQDRRLKSLRCIASGGEKLYLVTALDLLPFLDTKCVIRNYYGPAECVVASTCYVVTGNESQNRIGLPIGRPMAHAQIYILDEFLQELVPGQTGEIIIGGTGVFVGYRNQDKLTREVLIDYNGSRCYRTGDFGRLNAQSGQLEFLGRRDHQVKIRGQRIELDGIEQLILHFDSKISNCLVLKVSLASVDHLIAYVQCNDDQHSINDNEIRNFCQEHLPSFMVPSFFIVLDQFPLTHTGKIDRSRLPRPTADIVPNHQNEVLSSLERKLCYIFAQAFELSNPASLNVEATFAELGATSLGIIKALGLIRRQQLTDSHPIDIGTLLANPSVRLLAKALDSSFSHDELFAKVPSETGFIDSHVRIDQRARVQAHTYEYRQLYLRPVSIGTRSHLMANALVLPGCHLDGNNTICPCTLIMKGDKLPMHTDWKGSPPSHCHSSLSFHQ
ncbi:unnamed protein product [Rotaria sordida]|uniref:Carrier domain-containing protein n=1 Tax=Rotaria sordida TaxID=392033 RepID=A0A814NUT6_9BILA|nr:unnamed protein product [Rotaria sordida]CAF1298739.1 unnamed protein product [Rotaria sordida]